MASSTRVSPTSDALPFWAQGRISLFAFEALKLCKAPYGYSGKPATMRKLAIKGLVQQIESGAYVVTEEGIDLIEGRCRCPPELSWHPHGENGYGRPPIAQERLKRTDLYPLRSRHRPSSQGAVDTVKTARPAGASYTVEPTHDGCHVIRPRFGSKPRLRGEVT